MQSGFLTYHRSTVHYTYAGRGKPLVCFHGYGETSSGFRFLEKTCTNDFLIIAIDLPHHGKTVWNDGIVDSKILADIVINILVQLQAAQNDIHLLGFSLGGRMALCVLQEIPEKISKLVLLAPDGLTVNFWYWLSTQTGAGRKLFKLTMMRPGWFLGMLRAGNKARLINQSIYKFVEYYIHDEAVRKELYDRWTALRKCSPAIAKIRQLVLQHRIVVHLLYGRHDRIIGHKKGERFVKDIPGCRLQVLNCGHQVLHEKNQAAITQALLS